MKVNEIFASLQGEGLWTGTPAVFVRMSGCNLACDFCDTDHEHGTEMTEEEIVAEVAKWQIPMVVVTGGEPALQLTASLVEKLHEAGLRVHVETNGTLPLPGGVDWVTISPKTPTIAVEPDELKVLFESPSRLEPWLGHPCANKFVQPMDTGNDHRNRIILHDCMAWLMDHPDWRLSLQTHKILNIR